MKKIFKILLLFILASTAIGVFVTVFSPKTEQAKEQTAAEIQAEKENVSAKCDYSKVTVTAFKYGTQDIIDEKVINACFVKKNLEMGLIEISAEGSPVKVLYYNENPMKFLNVKLGESDPIQWRKNKGHDIFMLDKNNKLTFLFSDKKLVKGTVVFEN
jgi:hypothetical protein